MNVGEIGFEDDWHFVEFEADIVLDVLLEDVYFSVISVLVFAVVEWRLELLDIFKRCIEQQTLAEVFQVQHRVLVDRNVDEFLSALSVARDEHIAEEVDDGEEFIFVDY